jgi:hypothetical protein
MHIFLDTAMFVLGWSAGRMMRNLERQLRIDVPNGEARRGIIFLFHVLTIALILAIGTVVIVLT